jgi:hypothetical protein
MKLYADRKSTKFNFFSTYLVPAQLLTEAEVHSILLQIDDDEPPAKKSVSDFSRIPRKRLSECQFD